MIDPKFKEIILADTKNAEKIARNAFKKHGIRCIRHSVKRSVNGGAWYPIPEGAPAQVQQAKKVLIRCDIIRAALDNENISEVSILNDYGWLQDAMALFRNSHILQATIDDKRGKSKGGSQGTPPEVVQKMLKRAKFLHKKDIKKSPTAIYKEISDEDDFQCNWTTVRNKIDKDFRAWLKIENK